MAFEDGAGFGGAFVDLAHIALELRRRGVRVTICRGWSGPEWDELAAAGVTLLDHGRWDLARRLPQSTAPVISRAVYLGELLTQHAGQGLRYAAWARRQGVTHIFCNNGHTQSPAALLTARLLNIPCWAYFQGNVILHDGHRQLLPLVDHVFTVSRHVADQAARTGVAPNRLDVLYPGTPTLPPLPAPRTDGRIRVGMVGMLTRWKGQLDFLQAFALAAERAPRLDAWLFGRAVPGQEAYADEVHRAVRRMGLSERVRIVSDRTRPEQIYPEVDFTAHSSQDPEPFGRVVIEAMSYGRPVVAAAAGGPVEVIDHGVNGFLVAPKQHQEVAERLVRLAEDHERLASMGRAARKTVEERFTYPGVLTPLFRKLGL